MVISILQVSSNIRLQFIRSFDNRTQHFRCQNLRGKWNAQEIEALSRKEIF
jgi:hypothetical protein